MSASKLFAAFLAILLLAAGVNADEYIIPKRDISFDYTVEPVPKLGELFTVTATFELNQDIYFSPESQSDVVAILATVPRQELISGDTIISGKFARGERQTITATYRATKGNSVIVGMTVKTWGADTEGGEFYYAHNSYIFKEYGVAEAKIIPGKTYTDSATGVQIRAIPSDELKIPVTDKYGSPVVPTKTGDEYNQDPKINTRELRSRSIIKEIPLVLNDSHVYELTQMLNVSEQDESIFIFRDMNTGVILIPTFSDSVHSLGTITQQDDSTFLFVPANKFGEVDFFGKIDGQPFKIGILLASRYML